jgi:hypothetical protein
MILLRFGAACGVVLGLSIGVPGAVEAFTGETTATSLAIGLGTAFGPPALTALFLLPGNGLRGNRSGGNGTFRSVAYALNTVGLGLFTGVAFALNLVLFFLSDAVVEDVLDGPTGVVMRISALVFVLGTVLFGVTMIRDRAYPSVPAWGYTVALPLLALLAPLDDTPLTSAVHLVAAASLIWLSATVWFAASPVPVPVPVPVPAPAAA